MTKQRLWAVSGEKNTRVKDIVTLPAKRRFATRPWSKPFELEKEGWEAKWLVDKDDAGNPIYTHEREYDTERFILEFLADKLSPGASGTVRLYSVEPVCPSCTGVIEQFYAKFPDVILLVTSGE